MWVLSMKLLIKAHPTIFQLSVTYGDLHNRASMIYIHKSDLAFSPVYSDLARLSVRVPTRLQMSYVLDNHRQQQY